MFRRLFNRAGSVGSGRSGDSQKSGASSPASSAPPLAMFQTDNKVGDVDDRLSELAPFDACIEASDQLASTSSSSGRYDPSSGLMDCSILVSADGDLLIIPQEQQAKQNKADGRPQNRRSQSFVQRMASTLGEEYGSAIFMGNDMQVSGDKALNGFSATGWSIPAASLAMKQSADMMGEFSEFVEDLVLLKKTYAAQENQMVNRIRPLVQTPEPGSARIEEYDKYMKEAFPDQNFEITSSRVGPLSSEGGTVQATLVALESYFSSMAESESRRWKKITKQSGALPKLRTAKGHADQRIQNRQAALQEMLAQSKVAEDHLTACKEDSFQKWEAVHQAEETVTKLVEEKMMERSRLREQQRLEQIKQDEEKRAKDAAHGNLGATSSEIWDIVSAVAASMEEGSFEPMDLPQAPLVGPRDKSQSEDVPEQNADSGADEEEKYSLPIASRHELEEECRLPELRAAALAADEAIEDAANSLLQCLSIWGTTSRSARLAAETSLVDAANAQSNCLRSVIELEKESIQERLNLLEKLEKAADEIDVRADINNYITMDKEEKGGRSKMGDDDDGGLAAALAVLNNHVDGNMGLGRSSTSRRSMSKDDDEHDGMTAEHLEEAVEKFFETNPLLQLTDPRDEKAIAAQEEFEINVLRLCKIGKEKSSSGRSRRSNICFSINSKSKSHDEIPSRLQFDGLCRVFNAVLTGCDTQVSGVSLARMLMSISTSLFVKGKSEGADDDSTRTYVKSQLMGHPLWENEEFWDQALYQTVAESMAHSGVMSNFERPSNRVLSAAAKKKSEWTQNKKMNWYDLSIDERYEAASQVHAVVFAQIGGLAHSMMEFGCGLERSCAFARRMAIRHQLPMSQRSMLLQHLIHRDGDENKSEKKEEKDKPLSTQLE